MSKFKVGDLVVFKNAKYVSGTRMAKEDRPVLKVLDVNDNFLRMTMEVHEPRKSTTARRGDRVTSMAQENYEYAVEPTPEPRSFVGLDSNFSISVLKNVMLDETSVLLDLIDSRGASSIAVEEKLEHVKSIRDSIRALEGK